MFGNEGLGTLEEQVNAVYFITSLQGIVNRKEPVLFLDASLNLIAVELNSNLGDHDKSRDLESLDARWFNWMQTSGMFGERPVAEIKSIRELLEVFSGQVRGLVLWDIETPASVNLALTAAGCENLAALGTDIDGGSFQRRLISAGMSLPVKRDFTGFLQKAVNQGTTGKQLAYQQMDDLYVKTGKADPFYLYYNVDAFAWKPPVVRYNDPINKHLGNRSPIQHNGLYNTDYWVARRGLFVDLYPLDDQAPNDDPAQAVGTDFGLWNDILEEGYRQRAGEFGLIGGFVPWWIKYTSVSGNTREPVSMEQAFIRLATSYNLWDDGDAAFGLSNASFYQHLPHPKPEEFCNPPVSQPELETNTIYLCFFMLDYDGSAWVNQMAHSIYDQPGRSVIPLNWSINPILMDRIPHAFHYLLSKRTDKDFFGVADDGAGYVDPEYLSGANRVGRIKTDGFEQYCRAARPYFSVLNIGLTAFYISDREFSLDVLASISGLTPAGLGLNRPAAFNSADGVPVQYAASYSYTQSRALEQELKRLFERAGSKLYYPEFYAYRLILFRPDTVSSMILRLQEQYPQARVRILDAYTFMTLKKGADQLPPSSPWRDRRTLRAFPDRAVEGLEPVSVPDGLFTMDLAGSIPVWHLEPGAGTVRYFYFDVDDAFAQTHDLTDGMKIRISLRCDAPVTLGLQYNAQPSGGVSHNSYAVHSKRPVINSGRIFREVEFDLDRPSFKNSQNARADFRFSFTGTAAVEVKLVSIEAGKK